MQNNLTVHGSRTLEFAPSQSRQLSLLRSLSWSEFYKVLHFPLIVEHHKSNLSTNIDKSQIKLPAQSNIMKPSTILQLLPFLAAETITAPSPGPSPSNGIIEAVPSGEVEERSLLPRTSINVETCIDANFEGQCLTLSTTVGVCCRYYHFFNPFSLHESQS
jgi:hypothetical protein